MAELHLFRVTVRGRFHELSDQARALLEESAAEHDAMNARFTPDGSFVYDLRYGSFSFRYELRARGAAAEHEVLDRAMVDAAGFLDGHGVGYTALRATATDMADLWVDPPASD